MVGIWDPGEEAYDDFVDTDAAGEFTFSSVPPDDYLVHVYGTNTEPGVFWPSAPTEHTATLVRVTSGATATANFTMTEGATITGTPRDSRGRVVRGTDVQVFLRYGACATCWESMGDSIGTYGSDSYVADRLYPGTYRVLFTNRAYLRRFYEHGATLAQATSITVEAGQTRAGIDVVLRKGTFAIERPAWVSGTPTVARTLTAHPPVSTPRAAVTYRWLRGGEAIRGATGRTYAVRSADKGRRVSVRITLRRTGYLTVTRTARASGLVR
jgi:hypothetical protein